MSNTCFAEVGESLDREGSKGASLSPTGESSPGEARTDLSAIGTFGRVDRRLGY